MQEAIQTIEPRPSLRRFRRDARRDARLSARLEGSVVTRHRRRRSTTTSSSSTSASSPRAACRSRSSARRGSLPRSGSATVSRCSSSASRTRVARSSSAARRPSARRAGTGSSAPSPTPARSRAIIFGRVKGGFAVDLGGAVAFLPGSQVDIRPVRDIGPLINKAEPFLILKMDRRRGNIVVCRRAVLEESRAEQRNELLATLAEGQILDGVVKNITDYGAFVDLGGLDGLLHVTDISLEARQPSERRAGRRPERPRPGDPLQPRDPAHLPRHEAARGRSLGGRRAQVPGGCEVHRTRHQHHRLRRLRRAGARCRGPGPRLRDELDQEERASRQDRSSPQEVEVMVLEVDPEKRRISLGLKQCLGNPWEAVRRAASSRHDRSRARSATSPSSACSSASTTTSTAWCTCPTSTGSCRARRPSRSTARATWSAPRCSTSTSRRSASRSASSSSARIRSGRRPPASRRATGVTCTVKEVTAGGIEVETTTRRHWLHPQGRAGARPRRAAARALRRRREARRQGDQHRRPAAG